MKRAVILHGTSATPDSNWFPWLKKQLENRGYEVYVPVLPGADQPNAEIYTKFLLNSDWDFNNNLLIGHSSGAVEILHLLQHIPDSKNAKASVLVGAFSKSLAEEPNWQQLKNLFNEPFDFAKIKEKSGVFLFVHGDDDPWCDPKQAQEIAKKTNGKYIEVPGGQHFSTVLDPSYTEFPKLIEILEAQQLL